MIKCLLDIVTIRRMCYKGSLSLVTFLDVDFSLQKYKNCTHLIAERLCKSEKFLAACAAGKLTVLPQLLKTIFMLKKKYFILWRDSIFIYQTSMCFSDIF